MRRYVRQWDFGDGETSTLRDPSHTYAVPDTYNVKLTITAIWPDTTVSVYTLKQVSSIPRPDLGYVALADEDISDLLRQPKRNTQLLWLGLTLLLSYLIFEGIKTWQRKVAIDEAPLNGPPIRQPLNLDPPPDDFLHTRSFYEMAQRLRQRRIGEGRKRPHIPHSVALTAQAGGFPSLAWHMRTHPSQYVLLVEQMSPHDHLAQLFLVLAAELESRDISIEVYFFKA